MESMDDFDTSSYNSYMLFIYAWSYSPFKNNQNIVKAYCLDTAGRSYILNITGYQFTAYVEIPKQFEYQVNAIANEVFCPKDAARVMQQADECARNAQRKQSGKAAATAPNASGARGPFNIVPLRNEVERLHKLYYYNTESALFIKCVYNSRWIFQQFVKRMAVPININGAPVSLKLHEADDYNLTPVIKMLAKAKIRPVGWVRAYATRMDEATHFDHCLKCDMSCIRQNSDISTYPQFTILALDIECVSVESRTTASVLPNPEKNDDVIFNIGLTLSKNKNIYKYLFYLSDRDIDDEKTPILDNEGAPIRAVRFNTERELIIGLRDFIRRENPQIITGYNVIRFDLDYILKRAQLLHVYEEFLKLGASGNQCAPRMDMDEKQNSGKNVLQDIDIDGRIIIDMLHIAKGAVKLDQYTLSAVCAHYKIPNKDPMTVQEIFLSFITKDIDKLRTVGKYCTQDAYVSLLLFDKLTVLYELLENSSTCQVPPNVYYNRGHQVRFVSQLYAFCKEHGFVLDPANYESDIVEYVGAYNLPPKTGLWRNVLAFDFCLTGDTLVSMQNGTTRRLDSLTTDSNLYGYDQERNSLSIYSSVNGLQIKGERDIVHVHLIDGRVLKMTPDHKVMLDTGCWERAENLAGKYVKCGVSFTEDKVGADEPGWTLECGNYSFNMNSRRDAALAFARVIGYSYSVYAGPNTFYFDTVSDARAFAHDLRLIGMPGYGILKWPFGKSVTYSIMMPKNMYYLLNSSDTVYDFVLRADCPASVVREFLGGLYGGSGAAPHTSVSGKLELKSTRISANVLHDLHHKLGMPDWPQVDARVFFNTTGFRYNIRKSSLLYVSYLYKLYECELGARANCESFNKYIESLGVSSWFNESTEFEFERLPTFNQKVTKVCAGGRAHVYDIEVDTVHNYVANGVVVSNCSLYPSIIIAHNICFTTLVRDERDLVGLSRDDYNEYTWEDHLNCEHVTHPEYIKKPNGRRKIKLCKHHVIRFVKAHVRKGIVPQLVEIFLKRRKEVRAQMETVDAAQQPELYAILDKRQLSNKVAANAMYGLLGIPKERKGYVSLMEAASTVTYMGRTTIKRVIADIERTFNSTAVYGDTDSCMMVLNDIKDTKPSVDLIRRLSEHAQCVTNHVNKDMIKPMSLAYEGKVYHTMLVLAKKRYFNVLMSVSEKDGGALKFDVNCKGLALKRRGNCQFMKIVYKYAIEACIHNLDMNEILNKIDEAVDKMFRMQIPYTAFVITSNVRDKYKSTNIAQVKLAQKYEQRSGLKLAPDTRVSFVFVDLNTDKQKHSEEAELLDHFVPHRHVLRLNYLDYFMSQFVNPFDQLLTLVFGERVNMKALGYREKCRKLVAADPYMMRLYKYRANYKKVVNELKQRFAPRLLYFNSKVHEAEYKRLAAAHPGEQIELNACISWVNQIMFANDRVRMRLPKPIGGRIFGEDVYVITEVISILNAYTYVCTPVSGGPVVRETNSANLKLVEPRTIDIHMPRRKLLVHCSKPAFVRSPRFLNEVTRRKYTWGSVPRGADTSAATSAVEIST